MISKIELKWWKSHENTVLEFSKGTNVLVGINGSGKSSVMQAISFALFGEVPEVRSKRIKIEDIIMRKPRRMERAIVKLDFEANGKLYRVEREISKNGSDARLYEENKLVEVGSKRVSEKISEILGISYETFSQVLYSKQNELDQFLRLGKGDRVSLVDRILKIDKISEAKENLRSFKRGVEAELSSLRIKASEDVEKIRKEAEELKREIEELEKEKERLENELKEKSELKEEVERIESKLEEKRKRIEELKRNKRELEGKAKILESKVSNLPKIEGAGEKLYSVMEKLSKAKDELMQIKAKIGEIEGEKRRLYKELEEIKKAEEIAKIEVRDYSKEIEEMRQKISEIKANIDIHETSINQLEKAEAKCPVCGSLIKNKEEHIERHKNEIEKLKEELEKVSKEFYELIKLQEEEERKKIEVEKAKLVVSKKEEVIGRLREIEKKDYSKIAGDLEKVVDGLEKEKEELRKAVEREEMEKELENVKKMLRGVEEELAGISYSEEEHRKIRERLLRLSSEISEIKAKLGEIPFRIGDKKKLLKEKESKAEEIEKARKELKAKERALENLKVLLNALDDVQVIVRREFVEAINQVLADIWEKLYPYGDYSSIRIKIEGEGRKAGDYILQAREKDKWVNVDGIASGGERTLAALALRIAFAKALANIGILLLDEPTHNLDSNGIERLIEVLSEGIPEVLDQVILITHNEEMEKAATGIAYKFYRNKDLDEPTRVEAV